MATSITVVGLLLLFGAGFVVGFAAAMVRIGTALRNAKLAEDALDRVDEWAQSALSSKPVGPPNEFFSATKVLHKTNKPT